MSKTWTCLQRVQILVGEGRFAHPQRTIATVWAVPWEGASAVGFEKGWDGFHPAWFSSMRTHQTLRVCLSLSTCPLIPPLLAPQELPIFLSDSLSAPFLLSTTQSPILLWVFDLSLLPGRAWVSRPQYLHWVSSHGSSWELCSSELYLQGKAGCPRHQLNHLSFFLSSH